MKKRNISMIIIGLSGIVTLYLNMGFSYLHFSELFFSIVFYLILLIFFRKTKLIALFAIAMIVSISGYHLFSFYGTQANINLSLYKFYTGLSFFGALTAILISFFIVLQERTSKFSEVGFSILGLFNFVFFSLYTLSLIGLIARFFGPFPDDLALTFQVYVWVVFALDVGRVILQVLIIFFIARTDEAQYKYSLQRKRHSLN